MGRPESLAALMACEMPERYRRNLGTIGTGGQLRLLNSKVAVVGAGGLGGHIIELLARQGVGFLRIIDGDSFAVHNLNRQILATEHNTGVNKALAGVGRIAEINSDVLAEAVPQMLVEGNALELLSGMDVLVDALDNLSSRRILVRTAHLLGIPLIHAAIAGFTGQVTTILPSDSDMAKKLFSNTDSDKGIELVLGNPAATPAIAAAIQAQEVVKLLTGVGETLSGRLLYFDTEYNLFEIFQINSLK